MLKLNPNPPSYRIQPTYNFYMQFTQKLFYSHAPHCTNLEITYYLGREAPEITPIAVIGTIQKFRAKRYPGRIETSSIALVGKVVEHISRTRAGKFKRIPKLF